MVTKGCRMPTTAANPFALPNPSHAPDRGVMAWSFGISTILLGILFVVLMGTAAPVEAASYAATGTPGPKLWSNPTTWAPPGVPAAGDDVTIGGNYAITLDLAIGAPGLSSLVMASGASIIVPASGELVLGTTTGNFSMLSSTITLNGGKITVASGESLVVNDNSTLIWQQGTIDGGGQVATINSTTDGIVSFAFTGAATLDNVQIMNGGTITTSGALTLTMQNAGNIVNDSSGLFQISSGFDVNGTGGTATYINNFNTITKSDGTTSILNAHVINAGTITVNGVTSAALELSGGGSHNGNFVGTSPGRLDFTGGTHNMTNNFVGMTGNVRLTGGTMELITPLQSINNFTQTGGTLDGNNNAMTINQSWTFSGGTQTGGGATIIGSGVVGNIDGASGPMTLLGRTLQINAGGDVNYTASPVNYLSLESGGFIQLSGGITATFDLTTDAPIKTTTSGLINNGGLFRKTGGTGSSDIGPQFSNMNLVSNQTGTITFKGGGSSSGQFTSSSPVLNIDFASLNYIFSVGNTLGTGGFRVISGNVELQGNIVCTSRFTIDGAGASVSTTGSNTLTFNGGFFDFHRGSLTGNGTVVIDATSQASVGLNGATTQSGWKIINNNLMSFAVGSVGDLTLGSGATIDNESGGTLRFQEDRNIFGTGLITNKSGAFLLKIGGTGTSIVAVSIVNNGTVDNQVDNTILRFAGGGQFLGGVVNFSGGSNAYVEFGGGTFDFGGSGFSGAGKAWLSTGTVNINNPTSTTNWKQTGGTLAGAQVLTIINGGLWSGGTMSGGGTTQIAATANFTIGGPATLDNHAFTLLNSGAIVNFGGGTMTVNNGATINVGAGSDWFLTDDATIINTAGSGAINNSGNFEKTAGTTSPIGVAFNNNSPGTLVSTAGTIELGKGGSNSGSIQTPAGTAVKLNGGTFTFTGGSHSGAGKLIVNAGTVNVNGNITTTNLDLLGGTLVLNTPLSTSGTVNWLSLLMQGPQSFSASGTTNILLGATAPVLDGATFINSGTVNLTGTSATVPYSIINGASFTNNGTFDMLGDRNVSGNAGTIFNNNSLLRKAGGTGTSAMLIAENNTSATVTIQSGKLSFIGGSDIAATYTALAGTTLIFSATRMLDAASSIGPSFPGTVEFTSGTVTFAGAYNVTGTTRIFGGTATFNGAATLGTLLVNGGVLNGSSNVSFAGGTWTFGTLSGSGTVTQTGGTLAISTAAGTRVLDKPFVNNATVLHNTASDLIVQPAGTIGNGGTWDFNGDGHVAGIGPAGPLFSNTGTITKSAGTFSQFSVPVSNSGLVDASVGQLAFNAGGTHSGSFNVDLGAQLGFAFNPSTFSNTSSFGGTGQVNFSGTNTVNGTYNLSGRTDIFNGTTTFNSNAATDRLFLQASGSTLTGPGNVTVNLQLGFNGGTIAGTGQLILGGSCTAQFPGGTSAMTFDGRPVVLDGNAVYNPGVNPMNLVNNASFTNNGVFHIFTDVAINGTAGTSFTNTASGDFRKSSAFGSTTFGPSYTTSGLTNFFNGTVAFTGGFTQSAGTTDLTAGAGFSTTTTALFNGGALTGEGSIGGALTSSGATIRPGSGGGAGTTGIIAISGPVNFGTGLLDLEIGGTAAGTDYDVVDVSNSATLGGSLAVSLINAYTPANGTIYDIVEFTSSSGAFTETLPTWPGGGQFNSSNTGTAKRLTAIQNQADLAVTQSSTPAVHGQNVVFTITIANNGASPASSVAFTDSFTNATFVSVVPSVGSCTGTGPVNCSLGTINGSSSATVTLTLNANALGSIGNTASVTTTTFDANGANNSSTTSVPVAASGDLALAITDAPDPVQAGNNVTYTATLTNNGPSTSTAPTATFTLSGGTIVSATGGMTCTTTSNSVSCNMGGGFITTGNSVTVTIVATAGPVSSMILSGNAGSPTSDPVAANNSASQTTTVTGAADVSIQKTGPSAARPNTTATFTITVKNNGPSAATGVSVSDPTPARLTFISNSGACTTPFPCSLGTLNPGETRVISAKYEVDSAGQTPVVNTATVSSTSVDPSTANNTASHSLDTNCSNTAPADLVPAANATNLGAAGTLRWDHFAANSYRVYLGPAGGGCDTLYKTVTTRFADYSGLQEGVEYEWRVEALINGCVTTTSTCQRFTVGRSCNAAVPSINTPANGSVVQSPIAFSWTPTGVAGTTYQLFASVNGGPSQDLGSTTATTFTASLPDGNISWFVIATAPGCAQLQSQSGQFIVCNIPAAPITSVIGQASSGQNYTVSWVGAEGSTFEVQQAGNAQFTDARTTPSNQNSVSFRGIAVDGKATALYYRVRQKTPCSQTFGQYSIPVRVVIVPLPPKGQRNPSVNVPAGSKEVIVQEIFIPGEPGNPAVVTFSAVADKPWLTVRPSSGILPPDGVTLEVLADPANLPNGTFTGTVIVTINNGAPNSRGQLSNGTTVKSVPVSVSLVTPVTPVAAQVPPDGALIIPSVGHLDGLNSHWQSDIRVTNTNADKQQYQLTFTPAGADAQSGVKQTIIDIDGGATTALDDIVRNWYGIGSVGDSANGILEIRALSGDTSGGENSGRVSTVASSRTYNVTENGTLGQYIPAIPFSSFISKAAPDGIAQVLSLQQIAQSAAYRTNVGVVEAAGQPASVLVRIFNSAGSELAQMPLELAAGEQRQMNALLSTLGINNLADGRIEVEVTGGDGRVTAYASVVDNATNDPLLVSGVKKGAAASRRYVLPGVADINTGLASWRTDMRVFNGGTTDQAATLTYYPQNDAAPMTAQVVVRAGEVTTLDNVLQSTFGLTNSGGAMHVTTPADSSLVVSGRTYNQTENGTYGQFVPAVTLADAVTRSGRALEIQQVEDSIRFRTNVGFAEVSGSAAEVEVTVTLPDSRISPKLSLTIPANSFRQIPLLQELGLGNVYNARISVKVIGGDGAVSAYGSVIDMTTQDPTYVPAQ
jgi:uncharacterized repeat protein (TIGR01451 family)